MPRFSTNANGAIVTIGNNLMTCPASAPTCAAALIGKAPNNNNNAFDMINLDADNDPSTFNSSMSTLSLPTGATVAWAGLYWGARLNAGTNGVAGNVNAINQMSLRPPNSASYQTVAADASANALFGPYSAGNNAYQRFAVVTNIVQAAGSGDYWGANVVGGTGQDRYAGWALVVVYEAPGLPLRNLTVFDGFTNVGASSPQTITVSGFQAPRTGPVDTTLTMVAYEGDMTQTGDFTKLNGAQLATALSPGSNFFNSTNDWFGTSVDTRNPNDKNMLGYDIKNIGTSGIIGNGDTSATFTFGSTGDAYYPGVLTTAINLYAPDFTASSKTAVNLSGNSPAQPGDIIQYSVNYVNSGQDGAVDLVSTDPIPAGTSYVPGSLTYGVPGWTALSPLTDATGDDQGEFDAAANAVVVRVGTGASPTTGGTLGLSGMASYQFQVQVLPSGAGTTLTNTAHLAYKTDTTGIAATYDTSPVTMDVRTQSDVSITKTMTPRTVAVGAPITATLTVTDNGPNTATGVQVTDPLDGWVNIAVDTSGAPGASCTATAGLACTLPDMSNAQTAVIVVTGNLPASTPTSQLTMTNLARVSTTTFDPDLSNNLASDTVLLTQQADLRVTKTLASTSMTPGNTVTYNLQVTNNGPSDAAGIVLTDAVPAASAAALSITDASSPDMTCTSDVTATCTLASLPAGQSTTVTVTAQLTPSAAGGAAFANTANVTATTPDPDVSNNTATATSTVGSPSADVRVTKTASPATVTAGGPVTYTITATNWGPSDAAAVSVTDTLPTSVIINSATNSRGTCAISGQTVTCGAGTLLASLDATKPGASVTVTISGTIAPDATGTAVANTASASSATTPDPDLTNNQATATTPLTTSADLTVTKTATTTTLPALGDKVVYTITVTNNGPSDAQNVTADDLLPAGLDLDPSDPPTGASCDSSLHCTIGTLAAGASTQITVPTIASATGSGTMVETVTVASDTPDPQMANNTTSWTLTGDPQADLALDKTASAATFPAGGTGTYSFVVTNNGPNSSVPTLTDTLPLGLTLNSASSADCTVTTPGDFASGIQEGITCGDGTPLANGATVGYTVVVDVSPDLADGTTLTNAASVAGTVDDPSLGNNASTATVTVRATANLVASDMKWNDFSTAPGSSPSAAIVTSAANGTFVWLTMTFTNTGLATAQNATFTIDYDMNLTNLATGTPLAPIVDWNWTGTYAGRTTEPGCQLVQGEITCPLLDGSGGTAIAPGQSVTVSMLIGVRGPVPPSGKAWVNVATTTPESDYSDNYKEAPLTIGPWLSSPIIKKTAAAGPGPGGALVAGGTFSYTIQVYQQGQLLEGAYWVDAQNVQLTDPLPAGFHATNVTTSQGTCTNGDTSITCNLGTVAGTFLLPVTQPGPMVTVTVSGTIDPNTPAGTGIPNTATATTSAFVLGPITGTANVDIVNQADLRLLKFVDQTATMSNGLPVFYAGGEVGYTLVAFNNGPSDSGTSTVTDTLPLGLTLDPSASSPACTVTTAGTASTAEVVTCAVAALPAGTGQTLRLVTTTSPLDLRQPGTGPGCVPGDPSNPFDSASAPNPAGCDQYQTPPRQIDNTATIVPDGANPPTDPDPSNNTATVSAMLDVQADIAITATASTLTPAAGDTVTFTAISINNGPSVGDYPLGDVTFPPGFEPINWDVPGNICDKTDNGATPPVYTLSCHAIPAAPLFLIFLPGQAVTSVITVQIPPDTPAGTYVATGHTYSQTFDPDPANNWVSIDVQVREVSDLTVTKTLVSATPLVVGQPATYRLTVTNAGPSVATDVVVSDTVPEGMSFASATDPTGAPCPVPQAEGADTVLLCGAGSLAAGATASVTVTFMVDAQLAPSMCNLALVGSLAFDPAADDNQSTVCAAVTRATSATGTSTTTGTQAPTGGASAPPPSLWWLTLLAAGLVAALTRWHRRLAG